MHDFSEKPQFPFHEPPRKKKKSGPLGLILISGSVMVMLCCGGCLGFLGYVGVAGPETSIYVASDIPESYEETARKVGGLEMDEQIEFFYSDAMIDIEDSFYYVSGKKVVIYIKTESPPLTEIPFEEIMACELERDESPFLDGFVTIVTRNRDIFQIPVSSDMDRDVDFHETIVRRSPNIE